MEPNFNTIFIQIAYRAARYNPHSKTFETGTILEREKKWYYDGFIQVIGYAIPTWNFDLLMKYPQVTFFDGPLHETLDSQCDGRTKQKCLDNIRSNMLNLQAIMIKIESASSNIGEKIKEFNDGQVPEDVKNDYNKWIDSSSFNGAKAKSFETYASTIKDKMYKFMRRCEADIDKLRFLR